MIGGASRFVTNADFFALFAFVLLFSFIDATLGLAGALCVGLTRSAVPLLRNASTGMRLATELNMEIKRPHRVMLGRNASNRISPAHRDVSVK